MRPRLPFALVGLSLLLSAGVATAGPAAGAASDGPPLNLATAATVAAAGRAAAAQAPAAWHPTVKLGGYIQGEFDAGARGDTRFPESDRFFLRRARLTVSGAVLPTVQYKFQVDFAGGLGSSTSIKGAMTDGYVEWTKFAHAHVRFGQFKAPFGRGWLVASTQLVTAERTLATDRLTVNRQIGAMVSGSAGDGRLGYSAGLFNGNGRNTTVNDNGRFMYIVRGTALAWRQPKVGSLSVGGNAYWSTDTKLSMKSDFGLDSTPATAGADHLFTGKRVGVGVDTSFERGIWRVDAEFLRVRFEQQNGAAQPDVIARGWYVMPGAFVYKRTVQVMSRYEQFQPDTSLAGNITKIWLAGLNYYARGNNAKLIVDYLWVDAPLDPGEHQKLLAQVQVVF